MSNPDEHELLERVKTAERIAQEAKLVAAVYRAQIEHAVESAGHTNPRFLALIKLALDEKNIKDWAKIWRGKWKKDIAWLETAISQMKKVEVAANRLDTTGSPANAEIQRIILTAARAILDVQYVPSSVSLDDATEDEQS